MSSPALSPRFALLFGWLADAWNAWKHFWFAPADTAVISLIRLLTGGMLFYNLAVWSLDLEAFFSSEGLQPAAAFAELRSQQWSFSFWWWVSDAWLWHAHFASLLIVFLFFVGAGTRVTSVLAFLITISYSQRVPIANFGLDQILGILCLYLMLAPCGAAFSVDAVIRRRWQSRKRRFGESAGPVAEDAKKSSAARMAMRLIQIHLCMIYLWAGLAKLKGSVWWTGEAIWRVIANAEYQTADLTWLAWFPWVPQTLSVLTVAWELSFCVLVWNRRLRPLVLAIGTAMHLGIGAFLGMWTFGLIMCVAYLSFFPPSWPRQMAARWNQPFQQLRRIMSEIAVAENGTKNATNALEHATGSAHPSVVAAAAHTTEADDSRRLRKPTQNEALPMTESLNDKFPFDDEPSDDFLLEALELSDKSDDKDEDDANTSSGTPVRDDDAEMELAAEPEFADEEGVEVDFEFEFDDDEEEFDVMAALAPDAGGSDSETTVDEQPVAFEDSSEPEIKTEIETEAELADELEVEEDAEQDVVEAAAEPESEQAATDPAVDELNVDANVEFEEADSEIESAPDLQAEAAAPLATPAAAEAASEHKGCVLLFALKDNDRAGLQSYLESRDFNCFSVSRLSAVSEAVARVQPDVILLLGRKVEGTAFAEAVQQLERLHKAPVAAVVSPEQRGHILTKTMPGSVDLAGYPISHRDIRILVSGVLARSSQTDSGNGS